MVEKAVIYRHRVNTELHVRLLSLLVSKFYLTWRLSVNAWTVHVQFLHLTKLCHVMSDLRCPGRSPSL